MRISQREAYPSRDVAEPGFGSENESTCRAAMFSVENCCFSIMRLVCDTAIQLIYLLTTH